MQLTNSLYESPLAVAIVTLTHTHTHLTDRFAQHDRQTCIHALLNYFTVFFSVDFSGGSGVS